MDGRAWGHKIGPVLRRLCPLGNVLLGLIFVAAAIEVLRIGVEMAMRGVEHVSARLNMNAQGWAYWLPMCVLLIVGSGSYLLLETGFRRLLLVAGRVGKSLRAGAQRFVPPCCHGKIWMIASGLTLLPIIAAADWMIATERGYAPVRQGAITLWIVIMAILIAAFVYFLGRLGRPNEGGAILAFRLMLWYGLMKGGFVAFAGFALALLTVALNGVEIPPFGLLPLAGFLVCWWLGRNRFENAVGWWDYGEEDPGYAE